MNKEKRKYNRLKALLAEKDIASKTLADRLNVSPQTVSRWCTNFGQPTLDQLYAIAEAMDVPLIDILEPHPTIKFNRS